LCVAVWSDDGAVLRPRLQFCSRQAFDLSDISNGTLQPVDSATVPWLVPLVVGAGIAVAVAATALRRGREGAYTELARPYAAVAVVFAVGASAHALLRVAETPAIGEWVTLYLVFAPWTVFAVRYAGYDNYLTTRRVVGLVAVTLLSLFTELALGFESLGTVSVPLGAQIEVFASFLTLSSLAVAMSATALVAVATYRHDRLSAASAVVAVWPFLHPVATVQLTRPSTPAANTVLSSALFLATPVVLGVGIGRYDLLDYPAAVDTAGERAVFADTTAAVFVVDIDGRVVRSNAAARAAFGDVSSLADVTDCGIETLASRETVACWTTTGRRQFDPRVTPLYTDGGATLGHTVTFVDVTTREIRRQRLSVLNRVLRHNVQNQLDVIRAHAEEADATPAVDGVDRLDRLAGEIRRVERLLDREGTGERRVSLATFLETTVASATADAAADTTVAAPDERVTVDGDLCEYVVANLVENAVEHGERRPRVAVRGRRTDTGVRIVVADDGPGIPDSERAVIEAGEETPLSHATSVGLWGTRWAVGAMNGSLSFADSDLGGTEVIVELPEGSSVLADAPNADDTARRNDNGNDGTTATDDDAAATDDDATPTDDDATATRDEETTGPATARNTTADTETSETLSGQSTSESGPD
jgi:nitrogen-specific signal transduction histidine kinase